MLISDTLLRLETRLDALGWDRPAGLWSIDDRDRFDLLLPIPQSAAPADFLVWMASQPLAEALRMPPTTQALVFTSEAWSVDNLTAEEFQARTTRPSKDPRRVEIRMVIAVDRDMRVYSVFHKRGEDAAITEGREYDGRVVDALHTLFRKLRTGS